MKTEVPNRIKMGMLKRMRIGDSNTFGIGASNRMRIVNNLNRIKTKVSNRI